MIRDLGPYSTRNTSKGALLEETAQLLKALSSGFSISEVRTQALDGSVFYQRARASRQRIWRILHYRFLAQGAKWIIDDLKESSENGRHNPNFISLVYLNYALRDHLTFDFVTKIVWRYWCERHQYVYRDDVLWLLDKAADTQKQISRWSESSRRKLAGSILTALRDFGLFKGIQKKEILRPLLPLPTAEHLLRILTAEGLRGNEILNDPSWRLFLRSTDEVAVYRIRFSGHKFLLSRPR